MKRTINLFLAALLACFSAGAQNLGLTTVVIDPGHGGTDPGAVSRDGKTYEKTLTLDIAKRLSEKIKADCPDVKVILTRDKDKTVALNDRAGIANRVNAGLFISIHINSTTKSTPNGYSVHVLGKSSKKDRDLFAYNMDVCKRENSVILLEDDYTTTYQGFDPSDPESFIFLQLMQNSNLEQSLAFAELISENLKGGPISANRGVWQDPFLVLWKTSMPAVLVELGFISNSTDLETLKKAAERDKIATRLCKAFKKYKTRYDGSVTLDVEVEAPAGKTADKPAEKVKAEEKPAEKTKVEEKPAEKVKAKEKPAEKVKTEEKPADKPAASGVRYGVQIFAGSGKVNPKDKAFMGYTPVIIDTGKLFKYIIGVDSSLEKVKENLPAIREKYPDAFLVKIDGETVTRAK
ncbi:MAG: N-acetylmuramoyl-L-alanine amidase [Bacteroidales bacterium]|nr:N-acetylmuramoyl-L-alanine amidase [Bacteroidales bacterium]